MLWRVRGLTNAVRVLLDAAMIHGREVIVDDVHDIAHVDSASHNASGDENRRLARSEASKCNLSLLLGPVTMNRSDGQLHVVQEVVQAVDFLSAVGEDDRSHSVHLAQNAR